MANQAMDALLGASEIQAGDNQLKSISALIQQESEAQAEVETAEAMVEAAKARVNELKQKLIPEAMMEAGVASFTDQATGCIAELSMAVSGALGSAKTPEELKERERKIDVLIDHGAEEIVKLQVTVEFGKGEMPKALALANALKERGHEPSLLRTIHPQTLMSWLKKQLEKGASIPLDDLGLWFGQVAKIKRPKAQEE